MKYEIEWIPVTERLPEADKEDHYLVTMQYGDTRKTDYMLWWNGWNRSANDDGKYEIKNHVVAWAAYPAPWEPITAEELRNEKMEEDARDVLAEMVTDEEVEE